MPVPNPDRAIKAGVFAHVEIEPADRDEVLLAPREALRFEEGRTRLLVVRDGRVEAQPVELGTFAENEAEVLSGADGSELIVVGDAARTIAPGMRVRPSGTAGGAS
jgi:multidrug efflux pump subunit AcrA (membrane-fusion protein)